MKWAADMEQNYTDVVIPYQFRSVSIAGSSEQVMELLSSVVIPYQFRSVSMLADKEKEWASKS